MVKDPVTFKGFPKPESNYSKLPHDIIEQLPQIETLGEMKVILYILRHTWGFQEFGEDDYKRITLDEFMNGRKRKDGTRLDEGTGLARATVVEGLKRAEKHGFIVSDVDRRDAARVKISYRLRMACDSSGLVSEPLETKVEPLESGIEPRTEKDTSGKDTPMKDTSLPSANEEQLPQEPDPPKDPAKEEIPGCVEQWDGPPPPAAEVYRSRTRRWPRKTQYRRIHETVGDKDEDLEFWGNVVAEYDALGWNPMNVASMLEWFERRELPHIERKRHKSQLPDALEVSRERRRRTIEGEWTAL